MEEGQGEGDSLGLWKLTLRDTTLVFRIKVKPRGEYRLRVSIEGFFQEGDVIFMVDQNDG